MSNRRVPPGAVLAVAGVFVMTFVGFLRAPLLPSIGRDLEMDAFGLSVVMGSFGLGRVLVDLPAGRASDRHGIGTMFGAAGAVVAAGALIMAIAPHALVLYVAAALLGVGSSWAAAAGIAFFASAPRASRGTSVSMYSASLLTAQAVGPMVAGFAALAFDWRTVFGLGAIAAAAGAVIFARASVVESAGRQAVRAGHAEETDVSNYVLWVLYALPAVQFGIGAAVIQTLIPIIGEDELGFTPGTVGLAIGIGGGIRLLAAMVTGAVSDRFGRKAALIPGLAIQVAGLAVFLFDVRTAGWWLSIVLLTLGSIAVNVGGTMLADLSEGGPLGRRLGRFRLVGDSALMLAPVVTGWLFDRYSVTVSVLPLLAVSIAVLLGSFRLPETHRVSTR